MNIVFGTGPVGLAVIDALVAQGQTVRAINRRGLAAVPPGVEVVAGNAADPHATEQLCRGASVVYNCTNAPYTQWPELFPPLNRAILHGASRNNAKLVVMDNLYLYGPTGGKALIEDLPARATGRKGRVRAEMAAELLAAHERGDVQVTIGRASDFFGPGVRESAVGERVFGPIILGKPAQVMGKPDMLHTYSYVPDIGRALVRLGGDERAFGRVWHLPNAPTISTRAFIEQIGKATGRAARVQSLPSFVVRAIGLFSPIIRELAEMLYEFEEPFVVDHSHYAATFGSDITPLDQAIQQTVAWYYNQSSLPKEALA